MAAEASTASTVAGAGVVNVEATVGVVVASGGAATAVVCPEVRVRASSMAAGASTATVRAAAGGGDVTVENVERENVESIGVAAGGVSGEDVAMGIEVANTAVVVKDVEVAVSYFRK